MATVEKRIKCLFCESTFRDNFNLRRHINSKHPEEAKEILKVNCSICGLIYIRKKELKPQVEMCDDCKKRTDIAPPESYNFIDEEEFKKWKQKIEVETSTRYVKSRRSYNLKNGSVRAEFPCYRSSLLCPKSKRLRVKILGGNKRTATCPAKMICEFKPEGGEVSVSFFSQHKGHLLDANKMFTKIKKKPKKVEKPPAPPPNVDLSLGMYPNFSMHQPDNVIPTEEFLQTVNNEECQNNDFTNDIDLVLSQIENEGQITSNSKKWLSSFCSAVQNLASNKIKSNKPSNKKILRDNNVFPEQTTNEAHSSNKMTEEERQSIIQMVLDDL